MMNDEYRAANSLQHHSSFFTFLLDCIITLAFNLHTHIPEKGKAEAGISSSWLPLSANSSCWKTNFPDISESSIFTISGCSRRIGKDAPKEVGFGCGG